MFWNNCLNQVMTISCLLVQKAGKQTFIFQPWICDWTQNIHCYLPSWDLSLFILEVFILTGTVLFFMTGCHLNSGTVYLQTLLQLFIPNMEPGTIYVLFNILHTRLIIFCQSVAQCRKFTRLFHIGQCHAVTLPTTCFCSFNLLPGVVVVMQHMPCYLDSLTSIPYCWILFSWQ